MNVLLKILQIIIKVLLPKKISEYILIRSKKTKDIFTSSKELQLFFYIMFLPFDIFFSFFFALCKVVLLWLVPSVVYGNLKYATKQFYNDICKNGKSVKIALIRIKLFFELIILGREKLVSFGEKNPDKVFFVIRPYYFLEKNELATSVSNLLFHYYRNLQHLSYAMEQGWIPVVDWENYGPLPHQEGFAIHGTKNSWEYYWEQPSKYSLKEVYESKNVILSIRNTRDYGYIPSASIKPPFNSYIKNLIRTCPKYNNKITFNKYTNKFIDDWQEKLFPKGEKILGVSIRGASYGVKNVSGHPKQPNIDELITTIRNILNDWKMNKIFFACESQSVVDKIKEEFGKQVIILPRLRYVHIPGEIIEGEVYNPLYEEGHKYYSNLEYLTEMVLLSRCDSLLAGMSSGIRMVAIWNGGKFENIKIFEKGLW